MIQIKIYHLQDQENKYQVEKNQLKRTYDKKVICFVGSCKTFKIANEAINGTDFVKPYVQTVKELFVSKLVSANQ
jgi:hypothetical protein